MEHDKRESRNKKKSKTIPLSTTHGRERSREAKTTEKVGVVSTRMTTRHGKSGSSRSLLRESKLEKEHEDETRAREEFIRHMAKFVHEDPLLARYQSDISWRAVERLAALGVPLPELVQLGCVTDLTLAWSPEYDLLRTNVNRRHTEFPLMIVGARRRSGIQRALQFAREYDLAIAIRGGGHSSEGFSLCDGMVIEQPRRNAVTHIRELSSLLVPKKARSSTRPDLPFFQCRIEAGALLGPTYKRLAGQSLALPGGTCPNVGFSGLALGGGFGFMQRACGLTIDNVLEVELVDARGKFIRANAFRNKELFWALRGGGAGNFGVVTAFTVRVLPLREVVAFELAFDLTEFEVVLDLWQRWAPFTSRLITSELNLFTRQSLPPEPRPPPPPPPPPPSFSKKAMAVEASDSGPPEEFYQIVRRDDKARLVLTGQYLFEYAYMDYKDGQGKRDKLRTATATTTTTQEILSGESPVAETLAFLSPFLSLPSLRSRQVKRVPHLTALRQEAGNPHRRPFVKNRTAFAKQLWSATLRTRLKELIETGVPDTRVELGALGPTSEVNQVDPTATAFPWRNALFWVNVMTYWDRQSKESEHMTWSSQFISTIADECIPQAAYGSFPDRDIKDYMYSYYGVNRHRLSDVKAMWDRENVFHFPQSIPLPAPPPSSLPTTTTHPTALSAALKKKKF